jgi:SAM-dependent methyltransferase
MSVVEDEWVKGLARTNGRFEFESVPVGTIVCGVPARARYVLAADAALHVALGGAAAEPGALSAYDAKILPLLVAHEDAAAPAAPALDASPIAWMCRAAAAAPAGRPFRADASDDDAAGALLWARHAALAALALVAPCDGVRVVAELSPLGSRETHTVEYDTRAAAGRLTVRGRALVAHSFGGSPVFDAAARRLHGISFVVEATVACTEPARLPGLRALRAALHAALASYDRTNLDEHPDFNRRGDDFNRRDDEFERARAARSDGGAGAGAPGGGAAAGGAGGGGMAGPAAVAAFRNSTCEAFAAALWRRVAAEPAFAAAAGVDSPSPLELSLRVHESDVAAVAYGRRELVLPPPPAAAGGLSGVVGGLVGGFGGGAAGAAATQTQILEGWAVCVRGRAMVARSLPSCAERGGEAPIGGATLIVDATLSGRGLKPRSCFLIDICAVEQLLARVLARMHARDVNALAAFGAQPARAGGGGGGGEGVVRAACVTDSQIAAAVWAGLLRGLPDGERGAIAHMRVRVRSSDLDGQGGVEYGGRISAEALRGPAAPDARGPAPPRGPRLLGSRCDVFEALAIPSALVVVDARALLGAATARATPAAAGGGGGGADAVASTGMHHRVGLAHLLRSLPGPKAALFYARPTDAGAAARADRCERVAVRAELELVLADGGVSGRDVGGWSAIIDGLCGDSDDDDDDDDGWRGGRASAAAASAARAAGAAAAGGAKPTAAASAETAVAVAAAAADAAAWRPLERAVRRLLRAFPPWHLSSVILLTDDRDFGARFDAVVASVAAERARALGGARGGGSGGARAKPAPPLAAPQPPLVVANFAARALSGETGGTLAVASAAERACVALLRALQCESGQAQAAPTAAAAIAEAADTDAATPRPSAANVLGRSRAASEGGSPHGGAGASGGSSATGSPSSLGAGCAALPSAAACYLLAKSRVDQEARHAGVELALAHALAHTLRNRPPPPPLTTAAAAAAAAAAAGLRLPATPATPSPPSSVSSAGAQRLSLLAGRGSAGGDGGDGGDGDDGGAGGAGAGGGASAALGVATVDATALGPTVSPPRRPPHLPLPRVVRALDLGAGALSMARVLALAAARAAAFAEAADGPSGAGALRLELIAVEALAEVASVGAADLERVVAAAAAVAGGGGATTADGGGGDAALAPLCRREASAGAAAPLPAGWERLERMSGWLPAGAPAGGPRSLAGPSPPPPSADARCGAWIELLVLRADVMAHDCCAAALAPFWAELAAAPTGAPATAGEAAAAQLRAQHAAAAGELGADVVVACAFADLFEPRALAEQLHRLAPGAICYLPITFDGATTLEPPVVGPAADGAGADGGGGAAAAAAAGLGVGGARVPSDALVFDAYHAHLTGVEAQHLDASALVAALLARGAAQLAQGPSEWRIAPPSARGGEHGAVWEALLRFVARGTAAQLWPLWSLPAWRARVLAAQPTIVARNVDILARLAGGAAGAAPAAALARFASLVFVAPRLVRVDGRARPLGWRLPAGHVELAAASSLISSGTELKFFRGEFGDGADDAEPLDAAIGGMGGAPAYPLEYGYSLCGTVVAVGPGVPASRLGGLAFAFHPHASAAVVLASDAIAVPRGIAAADAIYLPAVETAISIAHDVGARDGERVLVVGQGMIGLLVVAVLAGGTDGAHASAAAAAAAAEAAGGGDDGGDGDDGTAWPRARRLAALHAVDPLARRRALARSLGADEAFAPGELPPAAARGAYDVAVEVSGNARALQSAIDAVRPGGRVVIASWYSGQVPLELGTRFHRSHVTIIASQVSELPAALRGTWDKGRRLDEAWRLLAALRPSRTLTTLRVPLTAASAAFKALDRGGEIAVEIDYKYKLG